MTKVIDRRRQAMGGGSKRKLSQIKNIAVHYSATKEGSTSAFENYWKNSRGWVTGGYHEVVLLNGNVELNYDADVISNGVLNHNTSTYHICYVGDGVPNDKQLAALKERAKYNADRLGVKCSSVKGHREFSGASTQCPRLNMVDFRKSLSGASASPKPSKPKTKTIPQMATEVTTGKHGTGHANRQRSLGVSDSVYAKVRAEVNRRLGGKKPGDTKSKPTKKRYPLPGGVLRVGSRGNNVKQLQQALNAANFKVGKVDGVFGAKTEDAVRRFQSVHDAYNVDGVYGPRTKTRLDKVVN